MDAETCKANRLRHQGRAQFFRERLYAHLEAQELWDKAEDKFRFIIKEGRIAACQRAQEATEAAEKLEQEGLSWPQEALQDAQTCQGGIDTSAGPEAPQDEVERVDP